MNDIFVGSAWSSVVGCNHGSGLSGFSIFGGNPLYCARNVIAALALAVLLAGLAGCSSLSVNYDYDNNVEWTNFKTYNWMEGARDAIDPAMALGNSSLLDQRIRNSVNGEMEYRGLAVSEEPDLLVVYHLGTQEKIQVTDWGYRYSDYYWGYGGRQIDVDQYTEGSLVIDLVDAKTMNLVWRGTGTKVLDRSQRSPEEIQARLDDIVAKIMASFPPK